VQIEIFNSVLAAAVAPGEPFVITGERVTLHMEIIVTVAATVKWYPEYTGEDPRAVGSRWFRETAEETLVGGIVNMPQALRTLQPNGGGTLAAGTHRFVVPFQRADQFCRIQMQITAGAATARVWSVFGTVARSP
jgi:hypothetical protein